MSSHSRYLTRKMRKYNFHNSLSDSYAISSPPPVHHLKLIVFSSHKGFSFEIGVSFKTRPQIKRFCGMIFDIGQIKYSAVSLWCDLAPWSMMLLIKISIFCKDLHEYFPISRFPQPFKSFVSHLLTASVSNLKQWQYSVLFQVFSKYKLYLSQKWSLSFLLAS